MKTLNKLYILAAAALGLTACNSDEDYLSAYRNDANAVRFSVQIADGNEAELQTKNNTFDADAPVFEENDEISVAAGKQEAVTYKLDADGAWQPVGDKYLVWDTEKGMQFNAYYPVGVYGASMTDFTLPTSYADDAALEKADYMTCSVEKDKTDDGKVSLTMKRNTARVIIQVKSLNNQFADGFTVKDIKMNLNSKGYKNSEVDEDKTNLTKVTTFKKDDTTFYAIATPTTEQKDSVFLTIVGTETGAASDTELTITGIPVMDAGKSYTYNLTLGKNKATIKEVVVAGWIDGKVIDQGVVEEWPKVDKVNHIIETNAVDQIELKHITEALNGEDGCTLKIKGPVSNNNTLYQLLGNNVTNLDLSEAQITTLPVNAFSDCTKLASFTLPSTVKTIAVRSFYKCSALTKITLPASVTTINMGAFASCANLEEVTCEGNLSSVGTLAFLQCAKLTKVTFKGDVTTIGSMAFAECTKLTTVDLSTSSNFTSVEADNVGRDTFKGATVTIYVKNADLKTQYESDANWTNAKTAQNTKITFVQAPYADANTHTVYTFAYDQLTEELIEEAVGTSTELIINGYYSYNDSYLLGKSNVKFTSLNLLETTMDDTCLNKISFGMDAIKDNVETLILSKSMTTVTKSMNFGGKLKTVTLPSSITTIGESAFQGCTNLTTVTCQGKLTIIGDYAFSGCTNFTTLDFSGWGYMASIDIPSIGTGVFDGVNGKPTVYLPTTELIDCFTSVLRGWENYYNNSIITFAEY